MGYRIIFWLSRLPKALLGILIAAAGIVETIALLLTVVLIKDLTATGADARDERLKSGLNWGVGFFFIAVTAAIGFLLLALVLAYRWRRRVEAS